MISKNLPANSFYHTCRYISNKQGAEVLLIEGVRGHSYKLMAEDFIRQQQMRPSKKLACFHGILSFYPGENPSNEMMKEIAKKYLDQLEIVNTQYAVSKHTDKAHLHLHIVANMVNNDGKSINDSYIGLRGKKIAQLLTQEYRLIPALEKNLNLTHLENLSETEANRYKIYMVIAENLPYCRNMEELETRLLKLGIETQYKYKGQTREKQGISFKTGDFCFKGSQVDRKYSFAGLEKYFKLKQEQELEQENVEMQTNIQKTTCQKQSIANNTAGSSQKFTGKELTDKIAKGMEKAVEILLKTEQINEELPYELLPTYRRRKKQKLKR
jgi:hypothetical protein